jgi:hypothetical protein
MITGNQKFLYSVIGTFQIIISAVLLFLFLFYLPRTDGTLVIDEWIRSLTMNTLLMISGFGILLRKKYLFLSSFCVYPMIILRRFDYIYLHFKSERIGSDMEVLHKAIITDSLFQIVCASLLISIMLFLLRDKFLSKFKDVTKKMAAINMAVGFLVYTMFFRL